MPLPEQEQDFASIVGVNPPPATVTPDMNSVVQPVPDIVQEARKPAASPQELEARKQGWQAVVQRVQSDPALMQAMLVMGAGMMQPIQPGDSAGGVFGRAAVGGMGAYNTARASAFSQQLAQQEEARKQGAEARAEARAPLERQELAARARAETARARSGEAEATVAEGTINERVKTAQTNLKKLELAQTEAEKDAALKDVLRDNDAVKAMLERPDLAEAHRLAMEGLRTKQDLAVAQAEERRARARQETATAGMTEMTRDVFKSLPEAEQQRLVKTKFEGHSATSAIVQQSALWGDMYDKLKASNAPEVAGLTREQYQTRKLKESSVQDAAKSLKILVDAGIDDPEIIQGYTDLIKQGLSERKKGAPGAGAPVKVNNAADYAKLPKGTRYIDPRGVERTKQ